MNTNIAKTDGFSTAISGLKAQQSALSVIGNNIANINAIGYKSGRMTFAEQLGQTVGIQYVPFTQGTFQSTGITTDLAINGDAFFVLDVEGNNMYTRAGNFNFNKEGILVNTQGFEVQGWMKNIGNLKQSQSGLLGNIILDQNTISEPIGTRNAWLAGNLNAQLRLETNVWATQGNLAVAGVPVEDADVATTDINDLDQVNIAFVNGDTINVAGTDNEGNDITAAFTYGTDGTTVQDLLDVIDTAYGGTAFASVEAGTVKLTDAVGGDTLTTIALSSDNIDFSNFINSVQGHTPVINSSLMVYDPLGNPHEISVEFSKMENPVQWAVSFQTTNGEKFLDINGVEDPDGPQGVVEFSSTTGQISSFMFDDGSSIIRLDPNNGVDNMEVNLNARGDENYLGLTMFNSVSTVSMRNQDGRSAGLLNDYEIVSNGTIVANFSNGDSIEIAQLATAKFTNPSGLIKIHEALLTVSAASGEATLGKIDELGSEMKSGVLEMSNVDLADQFTKMIEAQRAYQASSKILTTIDEIMMQTAQLKR